MTNKFPLPDSKKSISASEENILHYWKENNIFERTIESRSAHNEFNFFDGPPFATGLPHYGHILAGTIKDAIPRYKTMQGFRVNRKWGWDCHGVPVEFQVEKEHKIGGKPGIEKMGVGKFNELCRSVVMTCADDWKKTVDRMGRFVDFKDDYKTMDPNFMESVWWVFGELWKKGLIYEGEKVVAYSPKLGSPLSNFEANLNYKDIDEQTVTAKFELTKNSKKELEEIYNENFKRSFGIGESGGLFDEQSNVYFLAWTTTPWTLPSNLALAVHPGLQYSIIKDIKTDNFYIVACGQAEKFSQELAGEKEVDVSKYRVANIKGEDLVSLHYEPLFSWFKDHEGAFRVLAADYVSAEDGTGIVHQAPNFGEDDAKVCFEHGIKPLAPQPINDTGFFDDQIPELAGKYFRKDSEVEGSEDNANKWVLQNLGEKIFSTKSVNHSYPHCWRTDCALMYRGIQTWFVDVQKVKDLMIEKNQDINWLPEHLKNGRFGKMIACAPDWAISRNRYWGCPLPVWRCDSCGEFHVMSSRAQLEKKSGEKVDDLHKHFVDELTWDCDKCSTGKMNRVEEVLDCWFESGAMPYASKHYPFNLLEEGQDVATFNPAEHEFKSADFIAEGLDQTRGWFYTLHVLGCALFGKNIFNNVVTNGIVLAEDGQKMSKSKKNYPDPNVVFDKYGADAVRYYLLSSPVVRGENFRFAENGVAEVLKSVVLPLRSAYQFFATYANIDNWEPTEFTFVRHGEGTHNVAGIYSGVATNEHHLTDIGREEVKETAQNLSEFDILIASPFIRTQETAEIIKKTTGFIGEIITDERVCELSFGLLEGQTFRSRSDRMAEPTTEQPLAVQARLREFLHDMTKQHSGKKIVVCSHGGVLMALDGLEARWDTHEEMLRLPVPQTGKTRKIFSEPHSENELDRWILSALQNLLADYGKKMDSYDLEGALRPIPIFIDQLNNWYLRRNRQRFWAAGLDDDKQAGYQTMHHVLHTLAKVLAPICPFFAEELFQSLGGGESVHLDLIPQARQEWLAPALDEKMERTREIVGLSAGIRANAKIKLRQPLNKLQVAVTTDAELDLDVIAAEANVKSVEILTEEEVSRVAKKIVKVNARACGKKFGKKVQELIQKGKSGDFTELEDGKIEIAGEIIYAEEYESGFLTTEGVEAAASATSIVLLDTEITPELEIECMARELTRAVQELRKTSGLAVSDRIVLTWNTADEKALAAFAKFSDKIEHDVLADSATQDSSLSGEPTNVDGSPVQISIKKA